MEIVVATKDGIGAAQNAGFYRLLSFALLLCAFQMLDGIMTFAGVSRFGLNIEGNPLIRALISALGPTTALLLVKMSAIIIIVGLVCLGKKIPWITNALGAMNFIYLFGAILPWTYILFFREVG